MHADVPDAPLLLHLPQDGEVRRDVGAGDAPWTRSILGTLNLANVASICALHGGGVDASAAGRERAGGDAHGRRPEDLVLNPELAGNRARRPAPPWPAVHHVDDPAAVVDQRLEDLLERGGIGAGRSRPTEADDREHLTGRRNGPLNELSALLLLQCAEQLRRERQRSAGAERRCRRNSRRSIIDVPFECVPLRRAQSCLLPRQRDALRTLLLQDGTGHLALAVELELEDRARAGPGSASPSAR